MKSFGILTLLLLGSCATPEKTAPASSETVPAVDVQYWGSLPAMHRQGEVTALVTLDQLMPDENAIGLGARAGLWGEITVVDGTAFSARSQGTKQVSLTKGRTLDDGACLLVWASVSDWQVQTVERDLPLSELGNYLAEKIGHDGPTPFRILGLFNHLSWHVVDGPTAPGIEASCATHSSEGVQGKAKNILKAQLVGFYSQNHKAIFTRHDAVHHTHVIVYGKDGQQTGHLDDVVIPAGSQLSLPQ
jgi:acetolactate decarboxylase